MRLIILVALAVAACSAGAVDKTVRSQAARMGFVRHIACPGTGLNKLPCIGYIIDHRRPLDCGGADDKSNMQWLTVEVWRAKSKWERNDPRCEFQTHGVVPDGAIPWWKTE